MPDIDFVQLARPSKSLTKYIQQVGRVTRVSKGKQLGYVLDNVGMYLEHGMFWENWDWEKYFNGYNTSENKQINLDSIKENEENIITKQIEGDEELVKINLDLNTDISTNESVSLFMFFSIFLKDRYNKIFNIGYSELEVYKVLEILHQSEYKNAVNNFENFNTILEQIKFKTFELISLEQHYCELNFQLKQPINQDADNLYSYLLGNYNKEDAFRITCSSFPDYIPESRAEIDLEINNIKEKTHDLSNDILNLNAEKDKALDKYKIGYDEVLVQFQRVGWKPKNKEYCIDIIRKEMDSFNTYCINNLYRDLTHKNLNVFKDFLTKINNTDWYPIKEELIQILKFLEKAKDYKFVNNEIINILKYNWKLFHFTPNLLNNNPNYSALNWESYGVNEISIGEFSSKIKSVLYRLTEKLRVDLKQTDLVYLKNLKRKEKSFGKDIQGRIHSIYVNIYNKDSDKFEAIDFENLDLLTKKIV